MKLANANTARVIRDGGIEAMDALNDALLEVLPNISTAEEKEVRVAIAMAMSAILDHIVNPLLREHPDLDVDEDSWGAIAAARARERLEAKSQTK